MRLFQHGVPTIYCDLRLLAYGLQLEQLVLEFTLFCGIVKQN